MRFTVVPLQSEASAVSEVLGVDGPFSFPEKLFQQLWARREFDPRDTCTADGRRLKIIHPGRWNHLGGPDFRDARLQIEGESLTGDIELHLRAQDWASHAHAEDPAYANVILHVVLFPPVAAYTYGMGGRPIPIFALLPRLYYDLEEYASDAAVATLANRPSARLIEELGRLSVAELHAQFRRRAEARWAQKVRFASLRIAKLGWVGACHQMALEILGYRFNRASMLRLASRYPFVTWSLGKIDLEAALASERDLWSLQGVRPANHPGIRLRQYAAWTAGVPDWPERLRSAQALEPADRAGEAGVDVDDTRVIRRDWDFPSRRGWWADDLCGGVLGGSRLDNLICDGFLPLVAAGQSEWAGTCALIWRHWYPGDLPALIRPGLRDLGLIDGRRMPVSHGLTQGLLGWLLEEEQKR
ncbi:hypothetical protein MASR2M8_15250 [Opitutaceae bacterium]